jgi:hypothetical protein
MWEPFYDSPLSSGEMADRVLADLVRLGCLVAMRGIEIARNRNCENTFLDSSSGLPQAGDGWRSSGRILSQWANGP